MVIPPARPPARMHACTHARRAAYRTRVVSVYRTALRASNTDGKWQQGQEVARLQRRAADAAAETQAHASPFLKCYRLGVTIFIASIITAVTLVLQYWQSCQDLT